MRKPRERLYWIWGSMIQRCTNPRTKQFKDYGGRGIKVCERWRSYANFKVDMGEPAAGRSLERVNNNGDYEPSNCRWATRLEQNSNKRNCIYAVKVDGKRVSLKEYCRLNSLPYRAIVKRIQDRGWPIDLAVKVGVGTKNENHLISLWEENEELRQYLSLVLRALKGAPVLDRLIDEAALLADSGSKIARVA